MMKQISRAAKRRFRATWQVLQETFRGWQAHQISLLASSLAYYTLLSLAPLLALVMMIVGAVFGEAAARGQIVTQLQEIFGPEGGSSDRNRNPQFSARNRVRPISTPV